MPPETAADGGAPSPARSGEALPAWLRHAAVWVGVALAVVVLVVLGVAVLPAWWASLVGGWVQGVSGRGVPIGLGIGALFTVLPLGVGFLAFRTGLTSKVRITLVVVALLLLLPNVLTIAIALGAGDPRLALAVAAPGFRGATVVGMGLVSLALLVLVLLRYRSRRTRTMITEAGDRATQVSRERVEERRREAAEIDPDRPVATGPSTVDPDPVEPPAAEPRTE